MNNRLLYFVIPALLLFLTGSVFFTGMQHDLWKEAWITIAFLCVAGFMALILLRKPN